LTYWGCLSIFNALLGFKYCYYLYLKLSFDQHLLGTIYLYVFKLYLVTCLGCYHLISKSRQFFELTPLNCNYLCLVLSRHNLSLWWLYVAPSNLGRYSELSLRGVLAVRSQYSSRVALILMLVMICISIDNCKCVM
jgi:hypothetical protein